MPGAAAVGLAMLVISLLAALLLINAVQLRASRLGVGGVSAAAAGHRSPAGLRPS